MKKLGVKVRLKKYITIPVCLLIVVGCGGEKWSANQQKQLIDDCPKEDQKQCSCGAEMIMNEFTFKEYSQLRELDSLDENLANRIDDLVSDIEQNCGKWFS